MKHFHRIAAVILLSAACGGGNLLAQLPAHRYPARLPLRSQVRALGEHYNGVSLAAGMHQGAFLNPVFVRNLGQAYTRTAGFYWGGRMTFFPFFIDLTNFKDYYRTETTAGVPRGELFTHRGWEVSASAALLPYGRLARILMPYAGAGYQLSQLCLHCTQRENDPDDLEVPFNAVRTSAPFWKAGLALTYKRLRLEGEFKQSLALQNRYALNAWRIGFGWRLPTWRSLQGTKLK